jgi:hypothetical protein
MTILGVFKMSVSHARQGLQRFSKMGLASVKCRAQRQSNAVLGVGPMPWGVGRMPLSRRPNAVPLSVECRVGVGRMPYPRTIDRSKSASVECRAFHPCCLLMRWRCWLGVGFFLILTASSAIEKLSIAPMTTRASRALRNLSLKSRRWVVMLPLKR